MTRPTLSVCCLTGDPGEQGAAILDLFRDIADEIVVAVDSRASPADLAAYSRVANRLLRFTFSYFERHLSWLHAQCTGDWIFRIDGDEVPSQRLLAQLPEIIASKRALQYWFTRRWLFPDAGHWLDEVPWYPDFQCRLVRNDATLRFRGTRHSSAEPLFPRRYMDLPIYHLDVVIHDQETRRAKIEYHRELCSGLEAPGGGPHDFVFYLPEQTATAAAAVPVPDEDRALISRVIDAERRQLSLERDPPPIASLVETDRFWFGKQQTDEGAYRAEIQCIERDLRMYAGEARAIHFQVSNAGTQPWPWEPNDSSLPQVHFSYHWLKANTDLVELNGLRSAIPEPLSPGDTCIVPAMVRAPREPGSYILEADLVWHRWFDSRARQTVEVTSQPPAARLSFPEDRSR